MEARGTRLLGVVRCARPRLPKRRGGRRAAPDDDTQVVRPSPRTVADSRQNTPDGSARRARIAGRRDAGRRRGDVSAPGQAMAPGPRRRPRRGAADGGDQRRLRPPPRPGLDRPQRARRRAARARRRPGAWLAPRSGARSATSCSACSSPTSAIWLVTPTTTWASPQALLAASDRRLLWLLDDAVSGRVQTLRFAAIEAAEHSVRRPRRRVATLRVRAHSGRRFAFGELNPDTAARLAADRRRRGRRDPRPRPRRPRRDRGPRARPRRLIRGPLARRFGRDQPRPSRDARSGRGRRPRRSPARSRARPPMGRTARARSPPSPTSRPGTRPGPAPVRGWR